MSSWYNTANTEIAVSTRIRLARNIKGLPFPARMTAVQRNKLIEKVKSAIEESNAPVAGALKFINVRDIPQLELAAMAERHIISLEFLNSSLDRAVLLSDDESICVMIGEEDHIRIQVIESGNDPYRAYETAELVDDILSERLPIAFNKELGYLTSCPTNLGTGLRASVMLHLPVTEGSGSIPQIAEAVNKIGFTIRGMYGEGSAPAASLYQVSNQATLGITEKNAIDSLKIITDKLINGEKSRRETLNLIKTEDLCFRALGILKNSRILSSEEMMKLISRIKLGIDMGIIKEGISPIRLFIEGQPNMLMKKYGQSSPDERDINRAEYMRKELEKL